MPRDSFFRRWYGIGVILLIIMVAIGGLTRLTNSGLSMVDWKPLSGVIPPLSEADWQQEFSNYKKYPEYKIHNKTMTISGFKKIFFYEYLHRIFGRLIALYFFIPFLYLSIRKKISNKESSKVLFILLLVGFQGLLGWYMVKSGLSDNPHVSHIRLMFHLLTAMCLIIYTYIQYLRYSHLKNYKINQSLKFYWILSTLILVQISYGALVAGLKAGYAYNTFPLMNGSFLPPDFLMGESYFDAILNNPYTVQFFHRIMGIFLFITACYLIFVNMKLNNKEFIKSPEIQLGVAISVQVVIGVLTLVLKVPISLASIHQVLACFVLLLSVKILYISNRQ